MPLPERRLSLRRQGRSASTDGAVAWFLPWCQLPLDYAARCAAAVACSLHTASARRVLYRADASGRVAAAVITRPSNGLRQRPSSRVGPPAQAVVPPSTTTTAPFT